VVAAQKIEAYGRDAAMQQWLNPAALGNAFQAAAAAAAAAAVAAAAGGGAGMAGMGGAAGGGAARPVARANPGNSRCRLCGQIGHWQRTCPLNRAAGGPAAGANAPPLGQPGVPLLMAPPGQP
jgi:hypothetical protein